MTASGVTTIPSTSTSGTGGEGAGGGGGLRDWHVSPDWMVEELMSKTGGVAAVSRAHAKTSPIDHP